jgi:glycerol-3-phosphate acyltransferase PlsY
MRFGVALLAGYGLGAVPFAYLMVRASTGQDMRLCGNGYVGARNAMAVAGRAVGLGALLLEALKGAAGYGVAMLLGGDTWVLLAAAFGVVSGHWFACWLRFRGGVGQADSTGFMIAMWPLPGLAGIAIFGLGRLLFRPFNVAYGLAALSYLAVGYWMFRSWQGVGLTLLLCALLLAKKLVDAPRQRRIKDGEHTSTTMKSRAHAQRH